MASVSGGATLSAGSGVSFANQGLLAVYNGGYANLSQATLRNLNGKTLAGGRFLVSGSSRLQLSNNATITTDNAGIALSGAGSVIESFSTATSQQVSLDSTLANIGPGGTLALLNGRNFMAVASGGVFTDSGKLVLGGVTFTAAMLTVASGGVLSGNGTVVGPVNDAGGITASGGTLLFSGLVSGAGTIAANAGVAAA